MIKSISVRSTLCLLAIVVFVGCTVFLLQGMLPGVGLLADRNTDVDELGKPTPTTMNNPLGLVADHVAAGNAGKRIDNNSLRPVPSIRPIIDITKVNLLAVMVTPADVTLQSIYKSVLVEERRTQIMGYDMFYREALLPSEVNSTGQSVLLLHGMQFSSKTWLNLGTVGMLSAAGHRVVAVDLPGYGESAGKKVSIDKRGEYLNRVISSLNLDSRLVIVSPSMSGTFSLPFLVERPGRMDGFVPVAPVSSDKFTAEQYRKIKTPTLIIYGDGDEQLGRLSTENLKHLPNSQVHELPKSKHAAYLDQPELFHQLLYNFMSALNTVDSSQINN